MRRSHFLLVLLSLALSACSMQVGLPGSGGATPFIITATLPPTQVPSATLTPVPPTPAPTIVPVTGRTTTQVNVRATPSTTGQQLGLLGALTNIQIVGRDADTNWYQIIYQQGPGGTGWVTAQYINVPQNKDTIPVVGAAPTQGAAPKGTQGSSATGVVIQQVNVRKGPGTGFDSVGMLNPKDVAILTAKDPSGAWLQVAFAAAPDGAGWVAATYLQATGLESLPVIGPTSAPIAAAGFTVTPPVATPTLGMAPDDRDTAENPAFNIAFTAGGTRTAIYSNAVSSPQGDAHDWIAFTPDHPTVLLSMSCAGNGDLQVQLLRAGQADPDGAGLDCGKTMMFSLQAGQMYVVSISLGGSTSGPVLVNYTLRIENSG